MCPQIENDPFADEDGALIKMESNVIEEELPFADNFTTSDHLSMDEEEDLNHVILNDDMQFESVS